MVITDKKVALGGHLITGWRNSVPKDQMKLETQVKEKTWEKGPNGRDGAVPKIETTQRFSFG